MKNDPLIAILTGVLALITLASVFLFFLYVKDSRELRSLQTQVVAINNRRAVVNALANEAVRYGEKDPSIKPVLEAVNLRVRQAGVVTNQPATK